MTFDSSQLLAYLPMLILIGMGCIILIAETFASATSRSGLAWLGVGGCIAAIGALVAQWGDGAQAATHFQGMLVVDRAAVDRINDVDEAITFATLAAYKPVVEGEMVATVKLIPFGVEAKLRDAAVAAASGGALRIAL